MNQHVAYIRGVHGDQVRPIMTSQIHGAYSIVIGASWRYLHQDNGDTITLSLPDDSDGARCLMRAWENGTEMRVLRIKRASASTRITSQYAPERGIRYDGLYIVTRVEGTIAHGAERKYTIGRVPGQVALAYIVGARPTEGELEAWYAYKQFRRQAGMNP